MTTHNTSHNRPLSPHLQVYKPQLTSVTSILNRACGVFLVFGLFVVAALLFSAAMGEQAYNSVVSLLGTRLGTLALFGWSVALFYHLSNGVRHLLWDTGRLFRLKDAYLGGYLVLAMTAILTCIVWCDVFGVGG